MDCCNDRISVVFFLKNKISRLFPNFLEFSSPRVIEKWRSCFMKLKVSFLYHVSCFFRKKIKSQLCKYWHVHLQRNPKVEILVRSNRGIGSSKFCEVHFKSKILKIRPKFLQIFPVPFNIEYQDQMGSSPIRGRRVTRGCDARVNSTIRDLGSEMLSPFL